jgi:hypothetical protein
MAQEKNTFYKKQRLIFSGLPRPVNYNNSALDWMDDKWLLKQKFISENLPVPLGGSVLTFKQAVKIFNQIKKPVIVKPRAGSRGRHTSIFVNTPEQLKVAVASAKKLCAWVMVEEQLLGPIYRATVINFELCGVLRGDQPQVVGDGQQTIGELSNKQSAKEKAMAEMAKIDARLELKFESEGKFDLSFFKRRATELEREENRLETEILALEKSVADHQQEVKKLETEKNRLTKEIEILTIP